MKLYKDFLHDDDYVMVALERSMEELRKAKLDLPGPPQKDELPLDHMVYSLNRALSRLWEDGVRLLLTKKKKQIK